MPSFTFDGQLAPLLEFLEHNRKYHDRVRNLIVGDKLEVGPWFTQPDTFLVNGESLVRNLVLGIILSEKLGKPLRVAYLPDSFGLTPQLPQILAKTGINVVLFERGLCHDINENGLDFIWRAPEGSKVIAIYLLKGYCGASFLGCVDEERVYSEWNSVLINDTIGYSLKFFNLDTIGINIDKAKLDAYSFVVELKPLHPLGLIPIPIGCDQYIPRRDFCENVKYIVEGLSKADTKPILKGLRILEEVRVDHTPELYEYSGELRCARYRNVLWGTASTRVTIKQLSFQLENLLQVLLEPLLVFAKILNIEYNNDIIRSIWLRLLRSQFHDAICGTVSDNVARRIENELEEGIEAAKQATYYLLAEISKKLNIASNTLLVYNPLPYNEWNTVRILLPKGNWRSIIVDGIRRPLEKVVENKFLESDEYVYTYNHKPLSISTIALSEDEVKGENGIGGNQYSIWNQYIEVMLDKDHGCIIIRDKRTSYEVVLDLVDYGDYGDLYDYSSPDSDKPVELNGQSIREVKASIGSVKATLTINGILYIPYDTDARKRSDKLIDNTFTMTFTVYDNVPRIELNISIHNKASNHVLRLRIFKNSETEVYGDKAFIKQKLEPRKPIRLGPEIEPLNHVVQSWIALKDRKGGMAIALNGLHEVFVEDGHVEITLYRSVGWLSRNDLKTRKGHAGPPIPTPEAQYLNKTLSFNLAIIPFTVEEWLDNNVYSRIESYYRKPIAYFNNIIDGSNKEYCMELIELEPQLVLSALKPAEPERGQGVVLRVYNIGDNPVVLELSKLNIAKYYNSAWRATLDERVKEKIRSRLEIRPYSIETIVFAGEFEGE